MASSYCSVVLGDVLVKRARMLTAILSLAWSRADPNREAINGRETARAVAIFLRRVAAPIERAATNLQSPGAGRDGSPARGRHRTPMLCFAHGPQVRPFGARGRVALGGLRPPRERNGTPDSRWPGRRYARLPQGSSGSLHSHDSRPPSARRTPGAQPDGVVADHRGGTGFAA